MSEAEHRQKLTSEYWDNVDIFDEDLFVRAPDAPMDDLHRLSYRRARAYLQRNLGLVAAGNATEIRYIGSSEFNSDLEEGGLVVIDTEYHEASPIYRPYSKYWLDSQDGESAPSKIGCQVLTFAGKSMIYARRLEWGIVVDQGRKRFIQPFLFSITKLLPSGEIHLPQPTYEDKGLHGGALRLPLRIGEVQIWPRLESMTLINDSVSRIRSIDIVDLGQT